MCVKGAQDSSIPQASAVDVAPFGIDSEQMKSFHDKRCQKCGTILGLPPSNEDIRNEKPGIELALCRSRALLAPCGCITFCKQCADKMRICPKCKVKIIDKRPFTLFGYCDLD